MDRRTRCDQPWSWPRVLRLRRGFGLRRRVRPSRPSTAATCASERPTWRLNSLRPGHSRPGGRTNSAREPSASERGTLDRLSCETLPASPPSTHTRARAPCTQEALIAAAPPVTGRTLSRSASPARSYRTDLLRQTHHSRSHALRAPQHAEARRRALERTRQWPLCVHVIAQRAPKRRNTKSISWVSGFAKIGLRTNHELARPTNERIPVPAEHHLCCQKADRAPLDEQGTGICFTLTSPASCQYPCQLRTKPSRTAQPSPPLLGTPLLSLMGNTLSSDFSDDGEGPSARNHRQILPDDTKGESRTAGEARGARGAAESLCVRVRRFSAP